MKVWTTRLCYRGGLYSIQRLRCDGSLQVEMTGSSILEYVHRLDQQELVQRFYLTPPTLMTSSPTHLYCSDDECADDTRATRGSLSNGLSSMLFKHQCFFFWNETKLLRLVTMIYNTFGVITTYFWREATYSSHGLVINSTWTPLAVFTVCGR